MIQVGGQESPVRLRFLIAITRPLTWLTSVAQQIPRNTKYLAPAGGVLSGAGVNPAQGAAIVFRAAKLSVRESRRPVPTTTCGTLCMGRAVAGAPLLIT